MFNIGSPLEISLIGFIAFIHLYFLWLEMFKWTSRGPIAFPSIPASTFETTKLLAANQGLYNGFLAAGLGWSLFISDAKWAGRVAVFFLICIVVAGIYGGLTVSRKIMLVQALPALLTLFVLAIF